MPWQITSTTPVVNKKRPKQKNQHKKTYCKTINELIAVISIETVDADKIIIDFITLQEYNERIK